MLTINWIFSKGPFTNYVYKRRGIGGQKNRLFVNFCTIVNVNGGGWVVKKKTNIVNVVFKRPLTEIIKPGTYYFLPTLKYADL